MATIIVFASSLSIASILLILKAIELRFSRKNILLRFISRFDAKVLSILEVLRFRFFQLIQTVRYVLMVKSLEVFRDLFFRVEHRVMNEYRLRQENMMGRRDIINKGSVSFYLKKIAEDKGVGEKGQIVEEI
jgi:hypothetical protein